MSEAQNYVLAEQDYMSGMKYKDIAEKYGVTLNTVKSWKVRYGWNKKVCTQNQKKCAHKNESMAVSLATKTQSDTVHRREIRMQKSSVSSRSIFRKRPFLLSRRCRRIRWTSSGQIQIAYAAIIRAQQIMYVRDAEDKTVEKVERKDGNVIGEKWEVQQAWDKQANFLSAQARAQKELGQLIHRYDELLHKNWELATEEQKTRIEQMRANTERIRNLYSEDSGEDGVVIVNDAPASEDLGDHHSEVSADI